MNYKTANIIFAHLISTKNDAWNSFFLENKDKIDPNFHVTYINDCRSILISCLLSKNFEAFHALFNAKKHKIDITKKCQTNLLYYMISTQDEQSNYQFDESFIQDFVYFIEEKFGPESLQMYLDNEIEIGSKNSSVLHAAVERNNLPMVKMFVTKKAYVDVLNETETAPLGIAVLNRQIEIAKYLTDHGAKDISFKKKLILNMSHRFRERCKLLQNPILLHGLNLKDKLIQNDIEGFKHYVINDLRNFNERMKDILKHSLVLWYAIDYGNLDIFLFAIRKNGDINDFHPDEPYTPLMYLIMKMSEEQALFKENDNKNYRSMFEKILDSCRYQIKFGITDSESQNIYSGEKQNKNILHIAAEFGNEFALKILLNYVSESYFSIKDFLNRTPLFLAAHSDSLETFDFLSSSTCKPDFSIKNKKNQNLFHAIMFQKNETLIISQWNFLEKTFLKYPPVNDVDSLGNTPLHIAFERENYKVCEFLINEKKLSYEIQNNHRKSVWLMFLEKYSQFLEDEIFEKNEHFPLIQYSRDPIKNWKFPKLASFIKKNKLEIPLRKLSFSSEKNVKNIEIGIEKVFLKLGQSEDEKESIAREINFYSKLPKNHHSTIRKMLGSITDIFCCIFLETINGGNLRDLLSMKDLKLSIYDRTFICYSIATGMNYLHTNNCFYGNISLENIFIDSEWKIKIANFQHSKVMEKTFQDLQIVFLPEDEERMKYKPPEFNKLCLPSKLDVYAFGVLMFEILSFIIVSSFKEMKSYSCKIPSRLCKLLKESWIYEFGKRPEFSTIKDYLFDVCSFLEQRTEFREEIIQLPLNYFIDKIDSKNIKQKNFLGQGAFGEVWMGSWNDEKTVAVKKIKDSTKIKDFTQELNILMSIKHINVLRIYGFCDNPFQIVMEYCKDGNLQTWLKKNVQTREDLRKIALNICLGLEYIHNQNIVHLDLKMQNILMEENVPKICDFGLAKYDFSNKKNISNHDEKNNNNHNNLFIGTVTHMAPELIDPKFVLEELANSFQPNAKCDIYSLGITLWQLFHQGRPSFENHYNCDFEIRCMIEVLVKKFRPPFDKSFFHDGLKQTIEKMWQHHPNDRSELWQVKTFFENSSFSSF